MIGDNFGVCFVKIGLVFPELCTQKFGSLKTPYKPYGDKFFPIVFVAPRISVREFNFRKSVRCTEVVQPFLGKPEVLISNLIAVFC